MDFYASLIAMHAGSPYERAPKFADFAMPWAPPQPDEDDDGEG